MSNHVCPWSKYNSECKKLCQEPNEEDPQKQRMYCFEEMLYHDLKLNEESLSLDACRIIIEDICIHHVVLPPVVADGRGLRRASASAVKISLPRLYREVISVVHEACHVLTYHLDPEAEDHGPEFALFMVLILPEYIKGYNQAKLRSKMVQFGLEISPRCSYTTPSYILTRTLIQKLQIIRKFNLASKDHVPIDSLFKVLACNQLGIMIQQRQSKAWPGGIPIEMKKLQENTLLGLASL